jgi:hypothetical protein
VDAGDHDLRDRLDGAHHHRAQLQQVAHACEVAGGDVGEIVPRREGLALAGQHDAGGVGASRRLERVEQLAQVRLGERVAPLRTVHRDPDGRPVLLDQQVLVVAHPPTVSRACPSRGEVVR